MFNEEGVTQLRHSQYIIIQLNSHAATLHSPFTGHDWIIVTNYGGPDCFILHRHSSREPYHRQKGKYKSLKDALQYIDRHEKWFIDHKM